MSTCQLCDWYKLVTSIYQHPTDNITERDPTRLDLISLLTRPMPNSVLTTAAATHHANDGKRSRKPLIIYESTIFDLVFVAQTLCQVRHTYMKFIEKITGQEGSVDHLHLY